MARPRPAGLSLRFKLTATLAVLVAVFAVLEVGARALAPFIPTYNEGEMVGEAVLLNAHPTRLWYTAPGVKRSAGFTAKINELGLRGPMPADPRPAGLRRVLVVGDSSLFGHGVADDETYPAQLQTELRGAGLSAEVINGGTPGYSTEQTRRMLDEIGWDLKPDLLIIGNLWSDNNFDSFRDQDLLATAEAFGGPLGRSAFYRLMVSWVDRARGGRGARLVTWTVDSQLPTEVGRRVPLARYAENLSAMAQDARARGVGVAFLALTNTTRLEMDLPDASWAPYFAVQREVAAWYGVPLLEAQGAFLSAAFEDSSSLFVDTMHPSAFGHRLLAQLTARRLKRDGWPDKTTYGPRAEPFPGSQVVDHFKIGQRGGNSPQDRLFGG